jgi:hypothetical protein
MKFEEQHKTLTSLSNLSLDEIQLQGLMPVVGLEQSDLQNGESKCVSEHELGP